MKEYLLVVALLCWPQLGLGQADCGGRGRIEGQVLDGSSQPIANAEVTVLPEDCVIIGIKPVAMTDANGKFLLSNVPAGANGVHASKELDLYPDTRAAIYSNDSVPVPKVIVHAGELISGVVIKLGAKAAMVSGKIIDGETLEPVLSSRIRLSKVDDDDIMRSQGPDSAGSFRLLVPSQPIRLVITAPGYSSWQYKGQGEVSPGVIQLKPEEKVDVTVRLQREKR